MAALLSPVKARRTITNTTETETKTRPTRTRSARSLSPVRRSRLLLPDNKKNKCVDTAEPDGQRSYFLHLKGYMKDTYPRWNEFKAAAERLTFAPKREKMFGYPVPRDACWSSADGTPYPYSGKKHASSLEWKGSEHQLLADFLSTKIKELFAEHKWLTSISEPEFSSANINRYLSGRDSILAHSDDEDCLGVNPTIASVSTGVSRVMTVARKTQKVFDNDLKKKTNAAIPKEIRVPAGVKPLNFTLEEGDLFVFAGAAQAFWQHSIKKTTRTVAETRINFTFRPHFSSS